MIEKYNRKAKVQIFTRTEREYGMHGSTKWDDYPSWHTYNVWDVVSEYQDPDKSTIIQRRTFWDDDTTQREAEDFTLKLALELENKGFEVELEFLQMPGESRC